MGSASKKIRFPCNESVEKGWDSREATPGLQLPALGLVLIMIPVATRSISLLTKHHFLLLPSFPSSEPVKRHMSHRLGLGAPWISPHRSLGTSAQCELV